MAKKKKIQKIKRDADKLLRTGRYWEWLQAIEAGKLERQYPRERDQVWNTLIRKALRLARDFEEFCANVENIKDPPNLADFRLLMALKRFVEGDGTAPDLVQLKGLGPAAEILRERAWSWNDESLPQDKLDKLLETFLQRPESVSRRHYEQFVALLAESGLAEPVRMLGDQIPDFRQLNNQSNVKKGWSGVNCGSLKQMDHTLAGVSRKLPEALSRILLLPFCSQVAAVLQRLAGAGTSPGMAELVGAFPFLFPLVAGERAEELSRQLLLAHPEVTAGLNLAQIRSQIASGRFEENLVLLNRMRPMLREKFQEDDDFDGPFPFSSDVFENDSNSELREVFRALYDRVLNDVAVQAKDLAPRDSKELRRVMEKVLIDDVPFLVDDLGDFKELAPLLQRLIGAGCAGKRLALLTLLVARRNRSAALRSAAEKVLDQSPPVDAQDLKWLLLEFDAIYFPRLTALSPLLDRFRGDPALFSLIFLTIFGKTEDLIEIRTFTTERRGLLSSLLEMSELDLTEDFQTLRRELDELKSYQEMDGVRVYVSCFPRGCYTREGFLRWLDHMHGTDKWPNFIKDLVHGLSRKREAAAGLPFGAGGGIHRFIDEQFNAILHYLKEHNDDFRTMEIPVIQELVEVMAQFKKALQLDPTFLVRISNILGERAGAGENAAGPLQNELLELLRQLATPKPKARQSRRKRR